MQWSIEKKKIGELRELAKNPRKISTKQADELKKSLSKFGLCEPIVINSDGTIIGGHQRFRTLKKLGKKSVDVMVPSSPLSDEDIEELNIRLNKNQGEWDWEVLGNAWEPANLLEGGFEMEELQLEEIPSFDLEDDDKPKATKCTMTIVFQEAEHLQKAENRISTIIDEYPGASYKVKLK